MSGLLKLPAVALAVARASAGQAFDATETAGNAVVGLQTPEAQAVHPPPEGDVAVIPPTTRRRGWLAPHLATPGTHLLPPQGTTHLIRSSAGRPNHLWLEAGRGHGRKRWQQGRRGRGSRGRNRSSRSSMGRRRHIPHRSDRRRGVWVGIWIGRTVAGGAGRGRRRWGRARGGGGGG